ncbi:MAG: hypothetical protein ACYC3X_26160 [Pirellulaceae bacterium]
MALAEVFVEGQNGIVCSPRAQERLDDVDRFQIVSNVASIWQVKSPLLQQPHGRVDRPFPIPNP